MLRSVCTRFNVMGFNRLLEWTASEMKLEAQDSEYHQHIFRVEVVFKGACVGTSNAIKGLPNWG